MLFICTTFFRLDELLGKSNAMRSYPPVLNVR
jgi:hypothetical protein